MDDNPIPPLVDLAGKFTEAASWARLVQADCDVPNPPPSMTSSITSRRKHLLKRLKEVEAAIVRAREVLGG